VNFIFDLRIVNIGHSVNCSATLRAHCLSAPFLRRQKCLRRWLAQYQTSLPDKQLLQDKLNEFFELEEQQSEMDRGK